MCLYVYLYIILMIIIVNAKTDYIQNGKYQLYGNRDEMVNLILT